MKIKFVTNNLKVAGFRYFWLKYIREFDPSVHCAKCLVGEYSQKVNLRMPVNTEIELDEFSNYKCLYLCGVIGYTNNLHIPFIPTDNPDDVITAKTYIGDTVIITGAKRLPIPPLEKGYKGLSQAFTSCRNYQFGVSYLLPMQDDTH